jgi:3D (Asp-Asp-Asp) domain-containing protein
MIGSSVTMTGVVAAVLLIVVVVLAYGVCYKISKDNEAHPTRPALPEIQNIVPAPKMKPPKKEESRWTEWKLFTATAYTNRDEGCNDTTATGLELVPISRVVAVDPRVIPLHSHVEIRGLGVFYAEDKGQAINGSMVDIFMWANCDDDVQTALQFGLRRVQLRWKPPDSSD